MTTQTSRLSIVVDTENARENIRRLGEAVAELERRGNSISNMMRETGVSLSSLGTSSSNAGRGVNGLTTHVTQLNVQVNNSSRVINNTGRSLAAMSVSARSASASVDTLSGAFAHLQSRMASIQGLLAGGIFAGTLLSIAKTADAMQELNSQVKLVTKSHEEYLVVNERLHEMANNTLTDISATTKLYTNSARALEQLGKSQEQVLTFTNAVSLAMGVGGKSAQEQAAAILQLGQAMQSGVVQGDEFRSIAENAPVLLDLVAESLGKTRGEVRELSKESKITSEVMYNALANATPKLQKMFDSMPVTMGQAFGVLRNNYKKFVGDFINDTTGISGIVAQTFLGIAKHFDTFAKVALAGASLAVLGYTNRLIAMTKAKIASTVATTGLSGAVLRFGAILKAHPIMILGSIIVGVSVATRGFDETMNDLGATIGVVGSVISDAINLFSDLASKSYAVFTDILSNAKNTTEGSSNAFSDFFSDTGSGFQGLLVGTGKVFDALAVTVKTFGQLAGENIAYFVSNAGNLFKIFANKTADVFENVVNGVIGSSVNFIIEKINQVIETGNKISEAFGGSAMPLLSPYQSNFRIGSRYQVSNMVQTRTWGELFEENAKFQRANGAQAYLQGKYDAQDNKPKADLTIPRQTQQSSSLDKDKDKNKKSKKEKDSKQLITGELAEAIFWLSHKYKLNPNDVAAVISFETNRTFSTNARNSGTSGTGLFQLMQYSDGTDHGGNAKKWDYYGLSRDQFGALSPMEQMHYFDKFFQSKKLRQGASLGEIYDAVAGYGYRKGTKAYNKNKVWDANKDGIIRKGEAVTAKAFQQHRKNYFPNGIDLQAVGRAQADDAKIGVQNNKEQQKILDNQKNLLEKLFKLYESKVDIRRLDLKKELEDIDSSTLLSDDVKTRYKRIAQDRHKVQNALEKKRIKLEANQHKMSSLEILKDKKEIAKMEIVLRPNLTDKEYQYLLENSDEYYDKLINLEQKKSDFSMQKIDFELKKYNMSIPDKLEAEKDLAIQELDLREGLTDEILKLEKQAVESRYRFDLKQFQKSQQEKIDSFRNTIQANTPALTKLTDILNKNYMSKTGYEILQLDKSILAKKAEEIKRYDNLVKSINAQDDTGNYVINDVVERYRLLQEAEQAHQKELTAIVENGKLERQELDKNHAEYQMGLYKQGLDLFGSVWNTATDIVKKSLGEQSTAAKIMFGTQKAISIAQAILNTEQAYTKALAEGGAIMGIPMATMVRGLGYTSIGLMTSQAIAGFKTGGYTGNVGTSTVAGVVHGQEYVVNAQATKRIGVDNLNKLNSGGSIGGNVNNISVNVTVNSDGSADVKTNHQIGKELGQAIVVAVQNELRKEDRQGGRFYGRR